MPGGVRHPTEEPSLAMTYERLEAILAAFPNHRIAVLGDFFLDKYLVIEPALAEISIETGLEARQVVAIRRSPGAAGTVTNNLSALGVGTIIAVGAVGLDGEGDDLVRGLEATRVDCKYLLRRTDLFTPTYLKPMVKEPNGERELERLDTKNRQATPVEVEDAIIDTLSELVDGGKIDALVVLDQVQERNFGVVTDRVRSHVSELAAKHPEIVFFGDSRNHIGEFKGGYLKPNLDEATRAVEGVDSDVSTNSDPYSAKGITLAGKCNAQVFLTAGEQGIFVCNDNAATRVPGVTVTGEIDIVGAGDSATAGIVSSLCSKAAAEEAALIGNLCASVTIQKLATTGTASRDEVRAAFRELPDQN